MSKMKNALMLRMSSPLVLPDSLVQTLYGFRPTIGIREGLRKFAQWYAEYYK